MHRFYCGTKNRRWLVQQNAAFNGIDYLEVVDDNAADAKGEKLPPVLHVFFLKSAPLEKLGPENIIIEGGERVREIVVLEATRDQSKPMLKVTVNRRGDFSPYTLRLVAGGDAENVAKYDPDGPPDYIDTVLSSIKFSFMVDTSNAIDLMPEDLSTTGTVATPSIDYMAKDYSSFRQLILDRLAVTIPDWQETSPADLGMAMVEVLAYAADHLSYYQDAVATEAYLGTARTRPSIRRHARLLDYHMHEGCNARAWIHVGIEKQEDRENGYILPAYQVLHTFVSPDKLAKLSTSSEIKSVAVERMKGKSSTPRAARQRIKKKPGKKKSEKK